MVKHHGQRDLAGLAKHCKRGAEQTRDDRFGRLFPNLSPGYVAADVLQDIGAPNGPMDGKAKASPTKTVPVGHVFFGQFVDHDVTLDLSSSFDEVAGEGLPNARTPTLDLDCVYGAGPDDAPFMYVQGGPFGGAKLLTGADEPGADDLRANDLLRAPNGRAMIGDHRNDENRIVSQVQLGIIKFHNAMCDKIHSEQGLEGAALFEEARRETTWHYQWGLVNDFLVDMCGGAVVQDVLSCGRQFYCPIEPFIPVEFSVAAYRFGHSMAPMKIQIQHGAPRHELFGPVLGEGFSAVSSSDAIVDFREIFFADKNKKKKAVQRAETLDTKLAGDLLQLPIPVVAEGERSLATRNLLRGNTFLLPGGDKIAEAMGRDEGEIEKVVHHVDQLSDGKITEGVPLWLYILAEAEVIGRETSPGHFEKEEGLGPVGARIVAEVMIGLLELDPNSYLGANRNWVAEDAYNTIGKMLISVNSDMFAATS
ncbi:MAG: heme peroxidase family protein [Pseudomonadota bacterium]